MKMPQPGAEGNAMRYRTWITIWTDGKPVTVTLYEGASRQRAVTTFNSVIVGEAQHSPDYTVRVEHGWEVLD